MKLVDIGCNLASERLYYDHERIIKDAVSAGVYRQIITGSDPKSNQLALSLANTHTGLFATAGHHPHHANEWQPHIHRTALQAMARADKVVAVGEMGLDYNRNFATPANQRRCFEDQLAIAATVQKPVFLHERDAYQDFMAILKSFLPELNGAVWHCFTAHRDALEEALALGLFIGITGWICDPKRGESLRQLVALIPDDQLLLETDAPYLTPKTIIPTPRTNEPKYLTYVLDSVAQCRGQSREHIAKITTQNVQKCFRLSSL